MRVKAGDKIIITVSISIPLNFSFPKNSPISILDILKNKTKLPSIDNETAALRMKYLKSKLEIADVPRFRIRNPKNNENEISLTFGIFTIDLNKLFVN
jgi:hypothetical protein